MRNTFTIVWRQAAVIAALLSCLFASSVLAAGSYSERHRRLAERVNAEAYALGMNS